MILRLKKKGESYFKIKVTDETCFKENIKSTSIIKEGKVITKESDANFIPKEIAMYTCKALLQIQSVFFKNKDKVIIHNYYYNNVFANVLLIK